MIKIMSYIAIILSGMVFNALPAFAKTVDYSLIVEKKPIKITGKTYSRIHINGTIPGPTLYFTEGDEAVIHVTNKMKAHTSVHWHGLLLPGNMDGVPNFNGFKEITEGQTFTYRFKIRQAGTYWYHSHSMGQEQEGHYGSIVIYPKEKEAIKADKDYVILLSDFHEDTSNTIIRNLKKSSEYYAYTRRTVSDFFSDVKAKGFSKAWKNAKMWGQMRMMPTDLADINNYNFLMNGKTATQNWTGLFKKGERIRLRFINASAMSFYDVYIPDLKMTVIAADGQDIEPVEVDEFRFGIAETYDVIVTPQENKAYNIVAEPIDRTGFSVGTLAPKMGMRAVLPKARKRALLTMSHTGSHMESMMDGMHTKNHTMQEMSMDMSEAMDHSKMDHSMVAENRSAMSSGWVQADTPQGHRALSYKDLRYRGIQKDTRKAEREIIVRLGGNMERYIWTLNGKKYEDTEPINLTYGERVRLTFINETMMAHPMHLHGMFVQLENGQPAEKLPNKHTVIVAPGETYSVLLTADEIGEWAFHCHLLYHMMAGMMNKVVVAELTEAPLKHKIKKSVSTQNKGGIPHVH